MLFVTVAALLGTGVVITPLHRTAWQALRAGEPAFQVAELEQTLGQGITLGLLGGFRAIIADFLWLRTNLTWENRDLPATQTLIGVVATVDPRPLYFWINGVRMIAYDMPPWRIEAAGGYNVVPDAVQRRFNEEQARVALEFLERALRAHPQHPLLLFEVGVIHARRLGDLDTAARYYREAALQPGAPYYAARIYAETLKTLGRHREAYQWLREIHPTLPSDEPMALTELVLSRIRELEDQLGIPEAERYQEPTIHGGSD